MGIIKLYKELLKDVIENYRNMKKERNRILYERSRKKEEFQKRRMQIEKEMQEFKNEMKNSYY